MKSNAGIVLLLAASTQALAGTSCDDVKANIAAKLDAKHVINYTLETVPADKVGDSKVVGTCDAGARKIVYTRK
jgi:hypothetical protein